MIRRRDLWPLGALGFILAVTASWWALALWAVPAAPDWLERARSVCFNITESGLPDTKGWVLLIGQPAGMIALLLVGWGRALRGSIVHLASSVPGRAVLGMSGVLVTAGLVLTGYRVADARIPAVVLAADLAPREHLRLDRSWPVFTGLIDQDGAPFALESLEGRPAMVAFAFGHCQTVCPAVVHQVRAAREGLARDVSIVVFTLDPWRDTPGRLGAILEQFGLDPRLDRLVGGDVDAVERGLDAWEISRQRDPRTGDIVHPSTVYLVESDGTVAYASLGSVDQILGLASLLGWRSRDHE